MIQNTKAMRTKIQIKTYSGRILFEYSKKDNTIKDTVEEAVRSYANLSYADLRYADLRSANLRYANLSYADLSSADLSSADLRSADLRSANLRYANLSYADLRYADLSSADLSSADLRSVDLSSADLSSANLRYADLRYTDLRYADLRYADLSEIKHLFQIVPEEGSFIAWKKGANSHLIKLEIPTEAKRHNALGGRKCRAEFVKVLDIRNSKGHKVKECVNGTHDEKITYRIGGIVKPNSYDPDPLKECSHGIHFFLTKQEAKDW